MTISALSCHGNPLHPDKKSRSSILMSAEKRFCCGEAGVGGMIFSGCPAIRRSRSIPMGDLPLASHYLEIFKMAVG